MAIKVLREPPVEQSIRRECDRCKAFLEFTVNDGLLTVDRLLIGINCVTGTALQIRCPRCQNIIWVYDPPEAR